MQRLLLTCLLLTLCALWACVVTRAECDQNNRCDSGEHCFQSSGTTTSGYCRATCEDDGQCPNPQTWICASCSSLTQDYCLDQSDDKVCRPCACDPRCPPNTGCIDGICVADAQGCTCRGLPCDELAALPGALCRDDSACGDAQRCARTFSAQASGVCWDGCDLDSDCPNDSWLCADCAGDLCLSASAGKICRPCQCSPSCPEGSGCVDGVCVNGAEGCLCRGETCPQ